ncbi:nucleoside triphosphate pyrophosphohydrolase [Kribbibacterium absianum]|uniref:nucleoside triphosphate pyrophosphohydrolase n=1 Tax=Kribbibacterium absianum TaxID=3044210 RepID=UPI003D2F5EA9
MGVLPITVTDKKGHEVPLDEAPEICRYLRGCVGARVLENGLVAPQRFSAKQLKHLKAKGRGHRARATAGVCVAFTTTGTQVLLDVKVLHPLSRSHDADIVREVFDASGVSEADAAPESGIVDAITLEADGVQHEATVASGSVSFSLDNPCGRPVVCRIWLPYIMAVGVGNLSSNGELAPAPVRPLMVAFGDSITQGFVSGAPGTTWPVRLARSLDFTLLNQGVAGYVFDEDTLRGLKAVREADPSLVVVAYGTNDWSRVRSSHQISKAAEAYLKRVKKLFPTARVYVLSPLWRADEQEASASGRPLGWMAIMLRAVCHKLGLEFVDGRDLVPSDPQLFGDLRLHPNAAGAAHLASALRCRIEADGALAGQAGAPELSIGARAADEESRERPGAPGTHEAMDALVRTIWRLRQPDGCPWDKEQTHRSIKRNLVEEAYEAVDAIEEGSDAHLAEELGDVLMQVLLHAQIAADEGAFTFDDVAWGLNEKLIRRHPHVFGEAAAQDPDDVLGIWESVKAEERAGRTGVEGLLDSVPRSLPALMECQKLSARAARAGFDWPDVDAVWDKFAEERAEVAAEPSGSESQALEFGDLLFTLVNVARKLGIDAEDALRQSNAKFRRRWQGVETLAAADGEPVTEEGHERLEELWGIVKDREGGEKPGH